MEYSAQRVRSKTRAAVRRREEVIEQEEIEGGEINLIPYLDIVTNLMLFLLATVTAGLILVQIDTTLPDRKTGPSSDTPSPEEQPLILVMSIKRDEALLYSLSGLEGSITAPKATFKRTGRVGDSCDGEYMCEKGECTNRQCTISPKNTKELHPVFDYRAVNKALIEIATRRYLNKPRKEDSYQIVLQADKSIPYSTITSMMAALRCKLPELNEEVKPCALPTKDLKPGEVWNEKKTRYDTAKVPYDPKSMALFHDIQFSEGFQ